MGTLNDWEKVRSQPLGAGGQSTVYLVRTPARRLAREKSFQTLKELAGQGLDDHNRGFAFAQACSDIAREEMASELGALKRFVPRGDSVEAEHQSLARMKNEIAVLKQNKPGLPKLLDSNESENWIVTEYCGGGTLDRHFPEYRGNAKAALAAFVKIVRTVVELHKEQIIHRDIKPQNIFVGDAGELLLGDFGIVFLPNQPERLSFAGESVGPRDFMPPWVFLDEHPAINATFDVYMLGKVLWCMVSGRLKLPREEFLDHRFDVAKQFPSDPNMHLVNTILEKCIVAREEDCLQSARDLLLVASASSEMAQCDGQIRREGVPMRCRVCRVGNYKNANPNQGQSVVVGLQFEPGGTSLRMETLLCDRCGHIQFFKSGLFF